MSRRALLWEMSAAGNIVSCTVLLPYGADENSDGFLQIEDFCVHPGGRGGVRTDADLLAVRFPHRAERLYDDPSDIMEDDFMHLAQETLGSKLPEQVNGADLILCSIRTIEGLKYTITER